ncbi:hypothetical protein ACWEOW_24545 [Monashia sp. NPDC004114]
MAKATASQRIVKIVLGTSDRAPSTRDKRFADPALMSSRCRGTQVR